MNTYAYDEDDPDCDPSERAKSVLEEVRKYYALPNNGAGGALHIVTDDGNIDLDCVLFCINSAHNREDTEGERIAKLLLELTEAERQFIYESDKRTL